MLLTLARDSGISSLPAGREAMWYHLSALGHFCDTSESKAEQQKQDVL